MALTELQIKRQELAKLRILFRKARNEEDIAYKIAHKKREVSDTIGQQFYTKLTELDLCRCCELPLSECKGHVLKAA